MESKSKDIFLIAFGLVMLILISCKPKPEASFDVDSFQKSLEEIASGAIEWEHSVGRAERHFECWR